MNELNTVDKVAMYVGGGLVMLGVFVIGLIEMFLGATHPVDAEGAIVHDALVPIDIRAWIIMLGLVVWGLVALYKVVGPTAAGETASATEAKTAD